jgi:hypothetical protein
VTTIVKAKMSDGAMREVEAVFPPELDPRFDFAKTGARLRQAHQQRIKFLSGMVPAAVNFQIKNIDDSNDYDLDLVDQPRMNGTEELWPSAKMLRR